MSSFLLFLRFHQRVNNLSGYALNRHEGFHEPVPKFFLPVEVLLESGCKFRYPDIEKNFRATKISGEIAFLWMDII